MSMGIETLISVEEYLSTSYDPDMEYVDGVLVERNVGEYLHSRQCLNIRGLPEPRSKVKETRCRLSDVHVLLSNPGTKVLTQSAFIAIENLSEEDRMSGTLKTLNEHAAIGTPNIWLFDPRLKQDPRIELTRDKIFHE